LRLRSSDVVSTNTLLSKWNSYALRFHGICGSSGLRIKISLRFIKGINTALSHLLVNTTCCRI
jgi:hypothetical protein